MKITNIHERTFIGKAENVAKLFESLGTKKDRIWPRRNWPPMILDAPVNKHGRGGHGSIRYFVEQFIPGKKVIFRFENNGLSRGLMGVHYLELETVANSRLTIRHVIDVKLKFPALLLWPILIRPLHNALIEDALDNLQYQCSGKLKEISKYSVYVRLLRFVIFGPGNNNKKQKGIHHNQ